MQLGSPCHAFRQQLIGPRLPKGDKSIECKALETGEVEESRKASNSSRAQGALVDSCNL